MKRDYKTNKPSTDPTYSAEWSGKCGPLAPGLACGRCGFGVAKEGDSHYCPKCDDYVPVTKRTN